MNKKAIAGSALVLGILFILLAFVYWFTRAGSLPHFLPGYIAGDMHAHMKHGIGALLIALALFAYAWFISGPALPPKD